MAGPLIGNSAAFGDITKAIAMVAPVDSAVLLFGETGTGKELIAHAIHDASPRHHQRFVAVNCAAIPGGLLESELFGHERGAFTGAVSHTVGRFQAADRGTLSLTKSATFRWNCNPNFSERSRSSRSSGWAAAAARRRWTYG